GGGGGCVGGRTYAADGNPVANRNHSAHDQDGLRPGQRFCPHQRHWHQSVRVGRASSHPGEYAREFVDYARGHPDKLTYVAPIFGGLSHLSMVLFLKRAGLEMTPVSYKGGAAPLTDVIAGHVPIYFATLSEAMSQANSGAIRLLAVSSEKRVPQLPDVPTFAESGFPGFRALTWNGLMAPSAMPTETVGRIAKE